MANDFYTIADRVSDALDLSGNEVSDLQEAAPLLARLPAIPSSNGDTHKYSKYTQQPVVGFRAENAGRDFDHSVDTIVTDTLKILDFSWMVDKAVADAWRKGGAAAYVAREGFRHVKSALTKMETQLIYGTATGGDATGFAGLKDDAQLAFSQIAAGGMVSNGGGDTADTASSCYLLRVSESEVSAVFHGDMNISLGETIVQNFVDDSSQNLPVYYTPGCDWVGFQIGGAFSAFRICNLTADANDGLTDDKLYAAWAAFPTDAKPNLCVCSTRSVNQLRASRTATNPTGQPAPWPESVINGRVQLIESPAIGDTDAIES